MDSSVQACNARNRTQPHGPSGCVDWLARRVGICLGRKLNGRRPLLVCHAPSGGATPEQMNLDVGGRSVTVSDNAQATGALCQPIPTVALLRQLIGRKRGCQLSPQAKGGANRVPKRDSRERPAPNQGRNPMRTIAAAIALILISTPATAQKSREFLKCKANMQVVEMSRGEIRTYSRCYRNISTCELNKDALLTLANPPVLNGEYQSESSVEAVCVGSVPKGK